MDKATAEKLLDHAITTTGADGAFLYQIANQEYVVRIRTTDFWLWTWQDLTAYAHDLKHQKKKQRQADRAQHGIDPQESYHLALFA